MAAHESIQENVDGRGKDSKGGVITPRMRELGYSEVWEGYRGLIESGVGIKDWKKPTDAQAELLDPETGLAPAPETYHLMDGGVPSDKE